MPLFTNAEGDVVEADEVLTGFMEARGYALTPQAAEEAAEELKGKALDAALEDAGLSKSGTADEKRQRYAEHLASLDTSASDPTDPSQDQHTNPEEQ